MIQDEIFKKINSSKNHLVDVTGFGNWFCRMHPNIKDNCALTGVAERTINGLLFCPYCGVALNKNEEKV